MEEAAAAMLDMEEKLAQDEDGTYRNKVQELLEKYAGDVKSALDAGLPPAEFEQVNRLQAAIQAASTVVDRVWQSIHPGKQ